MEMNISDEFKSICKEIEKERKTEKEWALIESSDMFQTEHYCGGYDATENAFCFSYYDDKGEEFWFQITLEKINKIVKNEILFIKAKKNN